MAAISPAMLLSAPLSIQVSIVTANASSVARSVALTLCRRVAPGNPGDSPAGSSLDCPIRLLSVLLVGVGSHGTSSRSPTRGLTLFFKTILRFVPAEPVYRDSRESGAGALG